LTPPGCAAPSGTWTRQHRAGSADCFNPVGTHTPGRCDWQRCTAAKRSMAPVGELHRRLAEHRKTLQGALANQLLGHGADHNKRE
jgi:putative transposase